MTRVLITGQSGLVGSYIVEAAAGLGQVTDIARLGGDRRPDLTDADAAKRLIDLAQPDIVVNCAAFTDVDGCEYNPQRAMASNCGIVKNLVAGLPPESCLVQFSTDQVYPDVPGPHPEDKAVPVNTYGKSKLAGEEAALVHGNALVLRTNFFGPSRTQGRKSLSDWMIESFTQQRAITLFVDSLFSPLHMKTLADLTVECLRKGLTGVYNLGCRAGASKADFGLAIAELLNLPVGNARLGASVALPGRAPRPRDLRMDVTRIEAALGQAMPTLQDEISKLAEVAR